jgi:hypothetical protein
VRRSLAFVLVSAFALAATAMALDAPSGAEREPSGPALLVAADVPNDVRLLASSTWAQFLDAFPARQACISPVALRHAWTLPDRAAYHPDERVVVLRVPETAASLRATLIHEFAHHIEFSCPAHTSLREPFLAAIGSETGSPWFAGQRWEDVPSERFAEAVTVYVLGRVPSHLRVHVPGAALEEIERWATAEGAQVAKR